MSQIAVSIIIPSYNRLWSLPATVESCRNTKCATEIIVIDDGSRDGTAEWLEDQPGIVVILQTNQGKCPAVNEGFKIAKGKYIRFLDSDDMVNDNATDEQFKIAERDSADVVVSGYKLIDKDDDMLSAQPWVYCDDFIAQQLGECDSSHYSAYLFRKDFLNDIPHRAEFELRDDRMLVIEAALKKPKVSVHPGFALLHRVHDNDRLQFTSDQKHIVQNSQHLNIYKINLAYLQKNDELTLRRIKASVKILWPLAHWIAKYDAKKAIEVVNWIYQLDADFNIPEKGFLGLLYKTAGFKNTERLLALRRRILK